MVCSTKAKDTAIKATVETNNLAAATQTVRECSKLVRNAILALLSKRQLYRTERTFLVHFRKTWRIAIHSVPACS